MGNPVNIIGGQFEHNFAHNSGFDFSQRVGTGNATTASLDSNHYALDRWMYRFEASAGTMSFRSRRNNASPNLKTLYCGQFESNTGAATSVIQNHARTHFEKQEVRKLLEPAGGTFTIGFWYRSNRTGTHAVYSDVSNGFTGSNLGYAIGFNVPVVNVWQYVELTFDHVVSGATAGLEPDVGMFLNIGPRSAGIGLTTWNASDYFQITQVQINPGSVAANWRYCGGNVIKELLICQRYYEKSYELDVAPATSTSVGRESYVSSTNTFFRHTSTFKAPKRSAPSVTIWSETGVAGTSNRDGGTTVAFGSIISGVKGFTAQGNAHASDVEYSFQWAADAEF